MDLFQASTDSAIQKRPVHSRTASDSHSNGPSSLCGVHHSRAASDSQWTYSRAASDPKWTDSRAVSDSQWTDLRAASDSQRTDSRAASDPQRTDSRTASDSQWTDSRRVFTEFNLFPEDINLTSNRKIVLLNVDTSDSVI